MGRFSRRQHFLAADVTKTPDFESLQLLACLCKWQKVNSSWILDKKGARKCLPNQKIPPGNVCRKGLKFPLLSGNIDSLAHTTGTFTEHSGYFLYLVTPPDKYPQPPDRFPQPPDTFTWPFGTFPGHIGLISWDKLSIFPSNLVQSIYPGNVSEGQGNVSESQGNVSGC